MTIGFLFWLLMLLWLVLGVYRGWRTAPTSPYPVANDALVFVLLGLLGVATFGWPIRG
jgi:hypothetical protein